MKKILIVLVAVLVLSSCAEVKQCPVTKGANGQNTLDMNNCNTTKTKLLGIIPV
ncbi:MULTISPECIES: lipoprotein [unclassified Francisella]|uniref:lipoprotein n=1 Tax=unclassified Francisella TaxID=2610885 RepID=UPI002E312FFF|nr:MULTISPECIES: lipoprotein [unclassified Francisella]MED7819852.1 lipoprotein [Francisella sp. 19S2-4]MED7830684.1 lipoprotein [Francisella sp. 19S2-10]